MKKPETLRGTGTVFRYTLAQHYKTMSVRIFLIVLFVLAIASFPIIKAVSGDKEEITETSVTRLYLRNETPFALTAEDIHADSRYKDVELTPTESDDAALAKLLNEEDSAAAAVIAPAENGMGFTLNTYFGEQSKIRYDDASTLADVLEDGLHEAMLRSLNVTAEQEVTVRCRAMAQVATVTDYLRGTSVETDTGTHAMINLAYSYIILILSALSMSYIFQLCMEEKVSKLVESLLVSVSPTALLIGKILAASCMIFLGIGIVVLGLVISYHIAYSGSDTGILAMIFEKFMGLSISGLHLSIGMLLLAVLCILLAYAICAAFSGIVGSCCSKTEDTQQASLAVVMFIMIGYLAASLTPAAESDAVNIFCALFPLTSIFTALPNFICGKIGLPVFAAALAIQAVTAFLLARLAGAVYRMMLLYRGNVPKPRELFRMLRENRASAKGKEDAHEG